MPMTRTEPIDAPTDEGVHLFHAGLSNCSQRVRLALEEKGVEWISHPVDLGKFENLHPAFQKLTPKSLVPVFVHNGSVVVESIEIIQRIEDSFDGPALIPSSEHEKSIVDGWLTRVDSIQRAVKVLTYELFMRPRNLISDEAAQQYIAKQQNAENVRFMQDYVAGFPSSLIEKSHRDLVEMAIFADETLRKSPWLAGESFSLADIATVVNVHRMKFLGLQVSQFLALEDWYGALTKRPSFKAAIIDFAPNAIQQRN